MTYSTTLFSRAQVKTAITNEPYAVGKDGFLLALFDEERVDAWQMDVVKS